MNTFQVSILALLTPISAVCAVFLLFGLLAAFEMWRNK